MADTDLSLFMVIVQVLLVPEQAPLQPLNSDPASDSTDKVTVVPEE
jgi:hypothetical protein